MKIIQAYLNFGQLIQLLLKVLKEKRIERKKNIIKVFYEKIDNTDTKKKNKK